MSSSEPTPTYSSWLNPIPKGINHGLSGTMGAVAVPAGAIGGWIEKLETRKNVNLWYNSMKKPEWGAPSMAYVGPICTGLYSGIGSGVGYAYGMIYRAGEGFSGEAKLPLMIYGVNSTVKWVWRPLSSGAQRLEQIYLTTNFKTMLPMVPYEISLQFLLRIRRVYQIKDKESDLEK